MNVADLKKVGIEGPSEGKLIIDVFTVWFRFNSLNNKICFLQHIS